jgi:hypothetical protein
VQKMTNIAMETSFADLVFNVLVNCGTKAMVVIVPASNPIIVVQSITLSNSYATAKGLPDFSPLPVALYVPRLKSAKLRR